MHTALGWTYNYNQNSDVVSKAKGADTYSSGLKVATISLNNVELHHFAYGTNGARVSERRLDGTLVFFVNEYFEYSLKGTETHEKKYYGKEAMGVDGVLYFILTDHLGSTSIVTDGNGVKLEEQRYDAWGALRYSSGMIQSDKLYTGQVGSTG